jgi:hypothetical protein
MLIHFEQDFLRVERGRMSVQLLPKELGSNSMDALRDVHGDRVKV